MHEPTLTFDRNSGRFIMVYVRRPSAGAAQQDMNGRVYARTSTDGISWTQPQDLEIYAADAVDVACANASGNCLMTYMRASSNIPSVVNRAFTVSGSTLTLGSWTEDPLPTPWTPAAGVRTYSGANDWFVAAPDTETFGGRNFYYDRDTTVPFPTITFAHEGSTKLRNSFVSNPEDGRIYIWSLY